MCKSLRYLRIAWTVFCGLACVLLVVVWVRSYWRIDSATMWISGHGQVGALSLKQRLTISYVNESLFSDRWRDRLESQSWRVYSNTIEDEFSGSEIGAHSGLPKNQSFVFQNFGGNGYRVVIPHWFLILLGTSFATIPWLRWRFSLRTLLIATTLIAVMLGTIVWLNR
jgi:hypothetical protein